MRFHDSIPGKSPFAAVRYGPARLRTMAERPGNAVRPSYHRLPLPAHDAGPTHPLGRDSKLARVEALLMMADEPISSKRIAEILGMADGHEARRMVDQLRSLYREGVSSFDVADIAGGFILLTRPAFHPWLLRMKRSGHELRLTPAACETLAIVAYKQPVMRAEIEAIRGVNCVELLMLLSEKGLIRIVGRHDSLGRPQLFGTTKKFLQAFGMNSLDELPAVDRLRPPSNRETRS